ncbi:MAG TPA: fibronectin type III domain-containing protein, partial [Iamia sp.]
DPVDAGPDGLTGYVVEVEGAAPVEVGPEVDEAVVTGLGDDPVTVTVRARNAIGMGPASDPSAPASPHGPPTAAPTGVSVTSPGSSGDLVIEWEPVTADGGSPITAYEVRWGPGEDQVVVAGPEDVTASFGGLEDGVPHSFTVRARNADGDGPASEPVTARPGQAPTSGPSDVAATPTGAVGEVLVTWSPLAPEDVGTGPITGYRVDWGSGSTEVGPEAVTYLVEGLEVGSQYQVAVTALSEFGPGPASAWVDVFANAAPGDAPTGVVAVPTGVGGRVRVTWNPLPGGGQWGRYADTWIVTWDGGSTSLPVGRTTLEISGLDPEVDVAFRVRASNALGLGPLSEPSDAVRAGGLAPRPNLLDPESASNEQGDLGWVPVGVDIARSAMVAHDGVASLRVTSHGPGYEGTAPLVVSGVGDAGTAVEEGQTYRASFWVSAADVSRQATAFLSWSDAEGREMTMDAGTPVDEVVDGWVQVEVEATAPVGATHVAVGVAFDDAATGEVHHVDGAVLTTDEVDAPNLLSPVQSTMEGGEVRWVSRLGTTTRSTSLGAAGGHVALLLRQDELSTSGESATAFLPATALPTVAPGQEWSAAAWVRRGNRTSEVALRIGFLTADGLLLSSTTVDAREIGTEDWEELRGSAVVPDGAVAMTVGIAMVGGGWGDVVGLDEVAVWAGSPQDCCSNVLAVPDRSMETGDSGWVGDGFAVGRVGQAT